MSLQEVKHFHVCGGIGSGAAGFNDADPSIPGMAGKMVCIGGVDVDARACADFRSLTGVKQAQLDLFTLGMYQAFHGRMPPAGWSEAAPDDFRVAAHHQFPDIVFTSMPCKGFSGLLSATKSVTAKYVALNELTLRGVWLTMEAFADNPPGLFVFENVPRITSRGRPLLDQIGAILRHFGYAIAETTHDCGELGDGLAQSRRRFLLVARHMAKVQPFLYEPPKRPLRAVGEILSHMPLPGDPAGGPMHRVPSLNWKTWVRLAFVEAGSDWRSINTLAVEDGKLRDFLIVPDMHRGTIGVKAWDQPVGTITGNARSVTGAFSVADMRFDQSSKWNDGQAYGVRRWDQSIGTIAGQQGPGQGSYSVADPRCAETKHNNGRWSVQDPRVCEMVQVGKFGKLPEANDKLVCRIQALDGTWHRPFTTLELAALQSIIDPEEWFAPGAPGACGEHFVMDGASDQRWRDGIGNAVPRKAAKAIGEVMGRTILLARNGETFQLGSTPIWVRPLVAAITVSQVLP